ncbi:diacylglycerol kinase family protein [Paraflavitalea sp. CAU 1676]|uniref:diacylglycerol/lipid kinase family protein n=1 Tax=Paraflavitalea sp. CAU 1676 TaxID=3032598 RepID=UPI0023DC3CF3|nr:diacylglycerol kinase family protein [Paraflavitalea sp. CAU 1676]MDF2190861.1 diacylglycerol kinase family protein [Paraflavitalea sp. CAU 1676]
MSRKLIFLINPISGTKGKDQLRNMIVRKTEAAGIPFEIMDTDITARYYAVRKKIMSEGVTDIIICGGDGSVNQVVHALADTDVNFGIIPMGSGNGLAFAAGIPKSSEKALDVAFSGVPRLTDAFMVNRQFACMLCGLGFDAQVAHQFAKQPKRGLATYASLTTRNFFSAGSYLFKIEANNLTFTTDAFFLSIANSNQFGNNFTIAPKAVLSDGLLDVVIVKKIAKPLMLLNVMRQVMVGKLKRIENSLSSPVIYFQTEELHISNVGHAPMHIDGEPRDTPAKLHIKVMPQFFKLIHGV